MIGVRLDAIPDRLIGLPNSGRQSPIASCLSKSTELYISQSLFNVWRRLLKIIANCPTLLTISRQVSRLKLAGLSSCGSAPNQMQHLRLTVRQMSNKLGPVFVPRAKKQPT